MSEEKKSRTRTTPPVVVRPLRLHASTSDYKTFVETTIRALKLTGKRKTKSKPNSRLLSLVRSES
jgi:hypothetical protein